MASALEAANSRPSSESPAWKMTGRPCGLRGTLNWPLMSKCASLCANRPASASARNTPDSLSATISSPRQESNSSQVVCRNVLARSYRASWGRTPPRRKFSPVNASHEVTTFQAARPPDRWSRLANCRATSYGSLKGEVILLARPGPAVPPPPGRVFRPGNQPATLVGLFEGGFAPAAQAEPVGHRGQGGQHGERVRP